MIRLGELPGFERLSTYRPCWKKERHASRGRAEAAMRSLEKRSRTQEEKGTLHVYHCPECKGFHTGHYR